jgi:hypothetical protein
VQQPQLCIDNDLHKPVARTVDHKCCNPDGQKNGSDTFALEYSHKERLVAKVSQNPITAVSSLACTDIFCTTCPPKPLNPEGSEDRTSSIDHKNERQSLWRIDRPV